MKNMTAYVPIFLAIIILISGMSASHARDENDVAYKLMVIASLKFSDRETVESRFRFILPKFIDNCSDINNETKAAEMQRDMGHVSYSEGTRFSHRRGQRGSH